MKTIMVPTLRDPKSGWVDIRYQSGELNYRVLDHNSKFYLFMNA